MKTVCRVNIGNSTSLAIKKKTNHYDLLLVVDHNFVPHALTAFSLSKLLPNQEKKARRDHKTNMVPSNETLDIDCFATFEGGV